MITITINRDGSIRIDGVVKEPEVVRLAPMDSNTISPAEPPNYVRLPGSSLVHHAEGPNRDYGICSVSGCDQCAPDRRMSLTPEMAGDTEWWFATIRIHGGADNSHNRVLAAAAAALCRERMYSAAEGMLIGGLPTAMVEKLRPLVKAAHLSR